MYENLIIKKYIKDIDEISDTIYILSKNQRSKIYIKFLLTLLINHFNDIKKIKIFFNKNKNFPIYFACNDDLVKKNKNYLTYEKKQFSFFFNFMFKKYFNFINYILFPGHKNLDLKSKIIYRIQLFGLKRLRFEVSLKKKEIFLKTLKKNYYFGNISRQDLLNILPLNTFVNDIDFKNLKEIKGSLNASLTINNFDIFFFLNNQIRIINYSHGGVYGEYLNNFLEDFEKNLSNKFIDNKFKEILNKNLLSNIKFKIDFYHKPIWIGRFYKKNNNIYKFLMPDFYKESSDISYIKLIKKTFKKIEYEFAIHPRNLISNLHMNYISSHQFKIKLNKKELNSKLFIFDILSHSLIYDLIFLKKPFLIITNIPKKNITNNFRIFINQLRKNKILFDISEIESFELKLLSLIKKTSY